MSALAIVAVGACAPQYSTADWSAYISKKETLRFIAPATCSVPSLFNPVADDAAFFQVSSMQAVVGQPWQYDVVYQSSDGWRRDRFDIKQRWTAHKNYSAPSSAWRENENCAVLAEIPRSKESARPYYIEPAAAKEADYRSLAASAVIVHALVFAVLVSALIPSIWGFESVDRWAIAATFAGAILLVSFLVDTICIDNPWTTFQKAVAYYKFFDELPRVAGGGLLPLAPHQLYFLIAGPPHPAQTQFAFMPFAVITGGLTTIWLIVVSPFIMMGLYWLTTPLPLEETHRQALREGRAPTAEEIVAAVLKANVGKSAWQLNIMRRKAEAFARNLSDIARHL